MSIKEELKDCIIDQVERKSDWYYHGFRLTVDYGYRDFIDMYNNGIKCYFLRKDKRKGGYNGRYYVSLSKINNCKQYNSSYLQITQSRPAFIIEGIKPIKPLGFDVPLFKNTIFPIRYSSYEDEFQKFLEIKPINIVGLQIAMGEIEDCIRLKARYIKVLADILDYLISIESTLPFYGFDDPVGDIYSLDKAKCRDLINNAFK